MKPERLPGLQPRALTEALAASLVTFAADTGPVIVAEGIETPDELRVLRSLGISYGQGYYLGRPASLPLFAPAPRSSVLSA